VRSLVPVVCALAFTASGVAVADDGLGRLFHTPAERALLDATREAVDLPAELSTPSAGPPATASAPPPPTAPVLVNGIVQRERGPSTAWINGEVGTRGELEAIDGGQLRIGRGAVELSGAQSTRARVKPGQVFDPVQGRVVESFEQSVAPSPPAP
jgi:hypothetical protein